MTSLEEEGRLPGLRQPRWALAGQRSYLKLLESLAGGDGSANPAGRDSEPGTLGPSSSSPFASAWNVLQTHARDPGPRAAEWAHSGLAHPPPWEKGPSGATTQKQCPCP